MKISIAEAKKMFTEILATSGADQKDIETIVEMMLAQDLYQNKFSAFQVREVEGILEQLKKSIGIKSEIVVDKPGVKLIDGHRKSAWLVGREMVRLVCQMAKTQGIGMVGMYNSTYHNIMAFYSREIAQADLVGLVFANGGPASVAPYGGQTPIFGTNPLSYGIPTTHWPIVFDGATGQYAYGTIRLTKAAGKQLLPETYLDQNGKFTTNPDDAIGLVPFGGYKGYAINLMLDVLTGVLVRAKSGFDVKNEADLGSLFIAIDPSLFQPVEEFKASVTKLVQDVLATKPLEGFGKVRIPGYHSEEIRQDILKNAAFEVNESTWQEFQKYYKQTIGK